MEKCDTLAHEAELSDLWPFQLCLVPIKASIKSSGWSEPKFGYEIQLSLNTRCGATEPSGYGLSLIRLTGMVGCLVFLLRFSVSQSKHTQKQTRPL